MPNEVTAEQLAKQLENHMNVLEAYVLVREVKLTLQFAKTDFQPTIRVKVYTNLPGNIAHPYYFVLSHAISTPLQGTPYTPNPGAYSEEQAIKSAVSAISKFVYEAIEAGKEPDDSWLTPNEDF